MNEQITYLSLPFPHRLLLTKGTQQSAARETNNVFGRLVPGGNALEQPVQQTVSAGQNHQQVQRQATPGVTTDQTSSSHPNQIRPPSANLLPTQPPSHPLASQQTSSSVSTANPSDSDSRVLGLNNSVNRFPSHNLSGSVQTERNQPVYQASASNPLIVGAPASYNPNASGRLGSNLAVLQPTMFYNVPGNVNGSTLAETQLTALHPAAIYNQQIASNFYPYSFNCSASSSNPSPASIHQDPSSTPTDHSSDCSNPLNADGGQTHDQVFKQALSNGQCP